MTPVLARALRAAVAATVLSSVAPNAACAQDGPAPSGETALAPGTRVRVTVLGPRAGGVRLVGTVVALRADTLVARFDDGAPTAVARGEMLRLEVSRGMRRRTGQGAALGALGGALIGAVWGASSDEDCRPSNEPCIDVYGTGTTAFLGAAVVGGAGALVGAVVGSQARREAWRRLDVGQVRLGVAPMGRGAALAVGIGF